MECPYDGCPGDDPYIFKDGIRYKCSCCHKIYTAKTGTVFEASKLPMIKWFVAIWLVMHKKGVSSCQLAKDLSVQQKTAWFMLQRIRHVLGNETAPELSGTVQLDETFVGGKNKNRHRDKKVKHSQGRSFVDKTPVMGMLQQEVSEIVERPNKIKPEKTVKEKRVIVPSKIICKVIANTQKETIQPLVRKAVVSRATLVSDEWWAYQGLNNAYQHKVVDHAHGNYVTEDGYTTNAVEGHWSQFKRGIIGIYHQVSKKHLNKYVQEFAFKYNCRTFDTQTLLGSILSMSNCRLKLKELKATPSNG